MGSRRERNVYYDDDWDSGEVKFEKEHSTRQKINLLIHESFTGN